MTSEDRLTDLEVRLMHQEAAVEELSLASHQQQNQLNEILQELKLIRAMLRQLSPGEIDSSLDEPPPPHY